MSGSGQTPACLARRPRFMLVSDLDWTMVDHADATHEKLLRFNRCWMTEFAPDSLLVFSTGRSPPLFHELAAEVPLLTPDILVCSVGTEILINGQPDEEWEEHLNEGWDRAAAEGVAAQLPDLVLQRDSEQRPHKISFKLSVPDPEAVLSQLRAGLKAAGLDCNVIYSGGEDVDILPSRASKGKALSFLLKQMEAGAGLPEAGVMVCGDSGNDVELFAVPGVHGCVVANAHKELREWADANMHDRWAPAACTVCAPPAETCAFLAAGFGLSHATQPQPSLCVGPWTYQSPLAPLLQDCCYLAHGQLVGCRPSPAAQEPSLLQDLHGHGGRPRRHLRGPAPLQLPQPRQSRHHAPAVCSGVQRGIPGGLVQCHSAQRCRRVQPPNEGGWVLCCRGIQHG